jgi:hypothetical protein
LASNAIGKGASVAGREHDRRNFIVLELDASWPDWISELARDESAFIIEEQADDETADELSQRIVRRVHELAQQRLPLDVGLLLTNGTTDDASVDARYRMARAVLRSMSDAGAGELLLAAEAHIGDEARHQLFALAGTLCDELYGADLSVRVRFYTRAARSGTMPSMKPPGSNDEPVDAVG